MLFNLFLQNGPASRSMAIIAANDASDLEKSNALFDAINEERTTDPIGLIGVVELYY